MVSTQTLDFPSKRLILSCPCQRPRQPLFHSPFNDRKETLRQRPSQLCLYQASAHPPPNDESFGVEKAEEAVEGVVEVVAVGVAREEAVAVQGLSTPEEQVEAFPQALKAPGV